MPSLPLVSVWGPELFAYVGFFSGCLKGRRSCPAQGLGPLCGVLQSCSLSSSRGCLRFCGTEVRLGILFSLAWGWEQSWFFTVTFYLQLKKSGRLSGLKPETVIGQEGWKQPWGVTSLPLAGSWDWMVFKVPPNPNQSVVLWNSWGCLLFTAVPEKPGCRRIEWKKVGSLAWEVNESGLF